MIIVLTMGPPIMHEGPFELFSLVPPMIKLIIYRRCQWRKKNDNPSLLDIFRDIGHTASEAGYNGKCYTKQAENAFSKQIDVTMMVYV